MSGGPTLHWLPVQPDWRARLRSWRQRPEKRWDELVALANARLDFVATNGLDQVLRGAFPRPPPGLPTRPVRLALLSASTVTHLQAGIRVAGLRRNLHITAYECAYGQFLQELHDPSSALHSFQPDAILFSLDAFHLTAGSNAAQGVTQADDDFTQLKERIQGYWHLARTAFACPIFHQSPLPVFPSLLGSNEHRLAGSRAAMIARLNRQLPAIADESGVHLLALDVQAARDGVSVWHDPAMWHRAKQEVSPVASPVYGDLVARLLAAAQGRSAKCLVLDLDNTLWGGVVGDDGLEGLVLGEGSAEGEAFLSVQLYARELARRGVILAVCSKNDERNALEPFKKHPEMALKRTDIASFVANWSDKAANIRAIANELNIGLDALVFLDDNPFERNLVRQALPMVAVPEVPDDPALVPQCLADAGYFESLGVTDDDRQRTAQYQTNRERAVLKASVTDLPSYLLGLDMKLRWRAFDTIGLNRTVQLINKTNQFNLTTRRYTVDEVSAVMADDRSFGLQLRLLDRFGDNGIISIIIGHRHDSPLAGPDLVPGDLFIDTWLMSCRVLGRQVEDATLMIIVDNARRLGASRIVGEYRPTAKNDMVRDHYSRLGFGSRPAPVDVYTRWSIDIASYQMPDLYLSIMEDE